ncbi:hypothetical protein AVEN_49530-1 [Araneus ventricosus]|uniref:Uncharacterized protein n=1 Tax=Araneus ventricosus TaxID=182803 RepID=A0A4Y2WJR7_ARAVE|nr:hypothetical protein AVEN_49530-1 [Araneus ventricosus]
MLVSAYKKTDHKTVLKECKIIELNISDNTTGTFNYCDGKLRSEKEQMKKPYFSNEKEDSWKRVSHVLSCNGRPADTCYYCAESELVICRSVRNESADPDPIPTKRNEAADTDLLIPRNHASDSESLIWIHNLVDF